MPTSGNAAGPQLRSHSQQSRARNSSLCACWHARGTREGAFSRSAAPLPRPGSTVVRTADQSGATRPPSHRNGWSEYEQLGDPGPRAGPSRASKTKATNCRGTLQMRTAVRQLTAKMLHGPRSICRRPAPAQAREMGPQVGPVAGRFPSSDWRNGRHGCENGPFVPCRECVAAWKRRVWRPLWWVVIPRRNNEGSPGPGAVDQTERRPLARACKRRRPSAHNSIRSSVKSTACVRVHVAMCKLSASQDTARKRGGLASEVAPVQPFACLLPQTFASLSLWHHLPPLGTPGFPLCCTA